MPGVTAEQIEQAKRWDLLSYLQAQEPQELKRSGPHEYRTVTHDSLVISNGKWHWCSRGLGGTTALDYLIKVRDMPFVEAVQTLCDGRAAPFLPQPVKTAPGTDQTLCLTRPKCRQQARYRVSVQPGHRPGNHPPVRAGRYPLRKPQAP